MCWIQSWSCGWSIFSDCCTFETFISILMILVAVWSCCVLVFDVECWLWMHGRKGALGRVNLMVSLMEGWMVNLTGLQRILATHSLPTY